MDYSHPRFYLPIAVISILVTVALGFTISRGFYFGILGIAVFPFIFFWYKKSYDRDERHLLIECLMAVGGFIFLPIMWIVGVYSSVIPTSLDILFFCCGIFSMLLVSSLFYLFEPSDSKQLILTMAVATALLSLIIILIRIYTWGGLY